VDQDWWEHDWWKWCVTDVGLPTCSRSHEIVFWTLSWMRISPMMIIGVPPMWRKKFNGGLPCFQLHNSSRIEMDWTIWRCCPSCCSDKLKTSSRLEVVSSSNEERILWKSLSVDCSWGLRCRCKRQVKSRRRSRLCQCGIKQIIVVLSSLVDDELMARNAQDLGMSKCNWMQALMIERYWDIRTVRSGEGIAGFVGYMHVGRVDVQNEDGIGAQL